MGLSNKTNIEGILKANEIHEYILNGEQGQRLTALFAQESGVSLTVLGSNRKPIENSASYVTFYQGTLPVTGTYFIQLSPVPGVSQSSYNLSVGLDKSVKPTPTPSPTVSVPTPSPTLPPINHFPTPSPTENPPLFPGHEQNNLHTKRPHKPVFNKINSPKIP